MHALIHSLRYFAYHIISYHIISYHIISYHIISHHIISHHIISHHIISYHIISYHIISYHIISYHIISYHIISYHIISYLYCISQVFHNLFIFLKAYSLDEASLDITQYLLDHPAHTAEDAAHQLRKQIQVYVRGMFFSFLFFSIIILHHSLFIIYFLRYIYIYIYLVNIKIADSILERRD